MHRKQQKITTQNRPSASNNNSPPNRRPHDKSPGLSIAFSFVGEITKLIVTCEQREANPWLTFH